MGTIQLDSQMPQRFGLAYAGADNREHTPYVIHRALLGSLERFIGILIEHYGGAFPLWLAPEQARVLPVAEAHATGGASRSRTSSRGRRSASTSTRADETLGKRIRAAELEKVPYVVVFGDKESREALALRRRHGEQATSSYAPRRGALCDRASCYAVTLQAGASVPHLRGRRLAEVQPKTARTVLLRAAICRFKKGD